MWFFPDHAQAFDGRLTETFTLEFTLLRSLGLRHWFVVKQLIKARSLMCGVKN